MTAEVVEVVPETKVVPETVTASQTSNTHRDEDGHITCCRFPLAICGQNVMELGLYSAPIEIISPDDITCPICHEVYVSRSKCNPECTFV